MIITSRARVLGVGALIAVVLYLSGFLVIFTPLPLIYVSLTRGRREGRQVAFLALAAIVLLYLLAFPALAARAAAGVLYFPMPWLGLAGFIPTAYLQLIGAGYFAFFLIVGWTLSEGARRKWNLSRWGGVALLAGILVVLSTLVLMWVVGAHGPVVEGLRNYFIQVVAEIARVNQAAGGGGHLALLADRKEEISGFLLSIMPSIIFVFTLLVVVLNLLVGRRFLKSRQVFHHINNVARFRLPDVLIWGMIGGGVAFFAGRYMLRLAFLDALGINVLIGVAALYFFQGLAVIAYFLQGVRFPLFRALAYLTIIFFFQTLSVVIIGLGVADVWVNFRIRKWRIRHRET
jgi:hypothetical protein